MYLPEHFRESRAGVLRALIRRHPLAILIASVEGGALGAEHLPLQLVDSTAEDTGEGSWRLHGHLARANSLWREVPDGSAVLAVFMGADHYVSPTAYADHASHRRDVPTWNYAAIHVSGTIRFIHDPAGILEIVGALTADHEHNRRPAWTLADLADADRAAKLSAIVGLEIAVSAVTGKFKASQNRSAADRQALRSDLSAEGLSEEELLELVREPLA